MSDEQKTVEPKPSRRTRAAAAIRAKRRTALTWSLLALATALLLAGIALIYLPAALIAASALIVAGVLLDPTKLGRLTWPR
jgi:hypothetical protein